MATAKQEIERLKAEIKAKRLAMDTGGMEEQQARLLMLPVRRRATTPHFSQTHQKRRGRGGRVLVEIDCDVLALLLRAHAATQSLTLASGRRSLRWAS